MDRRSTAFSGALAPTFNVALRVLSSGSLTKKVDYEIYGSLVLKDLVSWLG